MLRYGNVITECSFNYFITYIENKLLNFLKKVLHVHIKGSIYRMRGRFEAYDLGTKYYNAKTSSLRSIQIY